MVTQYDMASYEVIAEPEAVATENNWQLAPETAPRLQTVAEAVALEQAQETAMPADLLGVEAALFVALQR